MYEFISLKLKCPECGKSLMDEEHKVDNESSIYLDIEINGKKGFIRLSSIYGSYNFDTNVVMHEGEIADFYCPHCHELIISDTECLSCGANMIPFYLEMGGKVSICSRNGCKNHFVEFEDLSLAMKQLYQDYGLAGKQVKEPSASVKIVEGDAEEKKKAEVNEILESGSFLHAYCPKCKKSLIEDEMLKLKISNGKEGLLMLSPYLNVFTSKSTIFLPEDKTVRDLRCFHCNESLIDAGKNCEWCGSPAARISVTARTKLIDFYICTKKGCRWHGLSKEDYYDIRLEDSREW
ncbi:MAG: hypothetical protein R6T99_08545 [Bacteroidales bacterium]